MRGALRVAACLALVALLGACAGRTVRVAAPTPEQVSRGQAWQRERERLVDLPQWSLTGRIAVAAGGRGGSGRIDWGQDQARYDIALSAPVTRQSWRLSGDGAGARLEGLEGGTREGYNAETLLLEATGWQLPVLCLPDWVRGLGCRNVAALAQESWSTDGRLARLDQIGWVIEYPEWRAGAPGQPEMPRRIVARRTGADASVRLVVDEWRLGMATP